MNHLHLLRSFPALALTTTLLITAACGGSNPPADAPPAQTPAPTQTAAATPAESPAATAEPTPEYTPPSDAHPAPEKTPVRRVKRGDALTTDQLQTAIGKPGVVRLTWSTESEKGNFGYNVMRADAKEGPFAPVNELVIFGAGDSSTTQNYEYYDLNVKVGDMYYYYVESISMTGDKERIRPVIAYRVNREFLGYEDEVTTPALTQ